ncbi:hypothetical protein [Dyella sp. Tek66A03]|uniref:hypothetical protein n=1 Tax=Dyella sp. Tek66A03 TaxID=3458298 RepID=UPI00403ECC0D
MSETNNDAHGAQRRFLVRWVFGAITDAMRRQIVAFWLREGALASADEAWRRSFEVASILQDASNGEIAGVCTVAIALDEQHRSYGFVRIFVGSANRHPGFNVRMMQRMIEGFEALIGDAGAPQRLLATIENKKLERRGGLRLLASVGFEPVGRTAQGELLIQRRLGI